MATKTKFKATDVYPEMATKTRERTGTTPGGRTYRSTRSRYHDGATGKHTTVSQGRVVHQKRTVPQKSGPDYVSKRDVTNKRLKNQSYISKSFTKKKGAKK